MPVVGCRTICSFATSIASAFCWSVSVVSALICATFATYCWRDRLFVALVPIWLSSLRLFGIALERKWYSPCAVFQLPNVPIVKSFW